MANLVEAMLEDFKGSDVVSELTFALGKLKAQRTKVAPRCLDDNQMKLAFPTVQTFDNGPDTGKTYTVVGYEVGKHLVSLLPKLDIFIEIATWLSNRGLDSPASVMKFNLVEGARLGCEYHYALWVELITHECCCHFENNKFKLVGVCISASEQESVLGNNLTTVGTTRDIPTASRSLVQMQIGMSVLNHACNQIPDNSSWPQFEKLKQVSAEFVAMEEHLCEPMRLYSSFVVLMTSFNAETPDDALEKCLLATTKGEDDVEFKHIVCSGMLQLQDLTRAELTARLKLKDFFEKYQKFVQELHAFLASQSAAPSDAVGHQIGMQTKV